MRRNRKRKSRVKGLFFTVVLLLIVLYTGFLLKGKIFFFFDKIIAGTITEGGNNVINGDTPVDGVIDKNIDVHTNNNTDNDMENDGNPDNPENNPGNREQNNVGGGNSSVTGDGKQLVENVDDILVIVNKKRYLESNYKPSDLVIPDVKFSFDGEHEKKYMRKEAAEALEEFFGQAYEEGIYIFALSGYRSYNTQKWLFENRANKVGEEEANKLIARPGESEHQTGLAMDITSQSVQFDLKERFGETEEGKWVKANAHKFGFIIRYTRDKEGITGYNYEPWHIRYVGKGAAEEIYSRDIVLEEYLD
ncbi:MAG TPA: M15 family metallopeptidase [Clostridia bacterium]|nr:M15 family metallopeptidase [Clostridia bacterium]